MSSPALTASVFCRTAMPPSPSTAIPSGVGSGGDPGLAAIEAALRQCLRLGAGCPDRLADAMRYAVLGPGKRLRPRLVYMAASACGGPPPPEGPEAARDHPATPAACAVELIHAYSLVHDDLPAMDDDDLRRGRPTVHVAFDEATAILAGDALQARAFELLAERVQPPSLAGSLCGELARAAGAERLVGGQAADLVGWFPGAKVEDLKHIHARKTGAVFVASLRMGALVASASPAQLQSVSDYAAALGLLFQVTDDLLDVAGDETSVGKRVGKDASLGKMTYPKLLGEPASRDLAERLAEQASRAACALGAGGEPLAQVARQVARRDR